MKQSGSIIVDDNLSDMKEALLEKGSFHLRHNDFICPACKAPVQKGDPDPCLGNLPGVAFACCGHRKDRGYIVFEDGTAILFQGRIDVTSVEDRAMDIERLRSWVED